MIIGRKYSRSASAKDERRSGIYFCPSRIRCRSKVQPAVILTIDEADGCEGSLLTLGRAHFPPRESN